MKPKIRIPAMTRVVMTGRRMKISGILIAPAPTQWWLHS